MQAEFYCQVCGATIGAEHNCNGTPIFLAEMEVDSIPAKAAQKSSLLRKGFHESFGPYGVYYYHHPMHGLLFLYPGAFAGTIHTDGMALDEYLNSLPDSSYTDLEADPTEAPSLTRCDACAEVGPLLPDEHNPFPHKPDCPQRADGDRGKQQKCVYLSKDHALEILSGWYEGEQELEVQLDDQGKDKAPTGIIEAIGADCITVRCNGLSLNIDLKRANIFNCWTQPGTKLSDSRLDIHAGEFRCKLHPIRR